MLHLKLKISVGEGVLIQLCIGRMSVLDRGCVALDECPPTMCAVFLTWSFIFLDLMYMNFVSSYGIVVLVDSFYSFGPFDITYVLHLGASI